MLVDGGAVCENDGEVTGSHLSEPMRQSSGSELSNYEFVH
jgi:hypothetical protein